jgi:hypothetical protein
MDVKEMWCDDADWIKLEDEKHSISGFVKTAIKRLGFHKAEIFLTS